LEAATHTGIGCSGGLLPEVILNQLLSSAGMEPLSPALSEKFAAYQRLLMKWNSRLNLTAIRSEEGILRRHFVECIFCARHLPAGISSLLDFGSGAGFPGLPIALCRPEISVTLAESQTKKSAFLREAVRVLGLGTEIYSGRVETLRLRFQAVAMRAVDKMEEAIPLAIERLSPKGLLALMASESSHFPDQYPALDWSEAIPLPYSEQNVLLMARLRR